MPAPKLPPQDLEAETSLLGAVLIDPEAIYKVADIVSEDQFYANEHQLIFKAMRELYEQNKPIDVVTLSDQLKKNKELKKVGGSAKLAEIANGTITSANVVTYATIVKDAATRRRLISLAAQMGDESFDAGITTQDLMDKVEQEIFSVSMSREGQKFVHIKDTLEESFNRIEQIQRSGAAFQGLPTGLTGVDNILSGMLPSNLIILAARPATGKTAFALNIASNLAIKHKKKVAFFSLEMSKEELVDRLIVNQADVDAFKLKTGRLTTDFDIPKISEAMGVLAEANIFIDDSPGLSIFDMRTQARRLMMQQHIDLLIVDYLQLAHGRTKDNRVQEVSEISQGLKNIARELKIPVIALSQLSRQVENRGGDKVPQLSDLRESGSIEQDADVVIFLYRKNDDVRDIVDVKIAKHRNGPVGNVSVAFIGNKMRFADLDVTHNVDPLG
ncbi:replicative DNA helicase [bacterium]|nr:replicative DNA helicase [bacterium]